MRERGAACGAHTEGVILSGTEGPHHDGPLERPMTAPKGQGLKKL